jgi:hypothetical protein
MGQFADHITSGTKIYHGYIQPKFPQQLFPFALRACAHPVETDQHEKEKRWREKKYIQTFGRGGLVWACPQFAHA